MTKEIKEITIGLPVEYEDDKHIIRTGLWLRENEVNLLEEKVNDINNKDKEIQRLNNIIETLKTEAFEGIMGFQGEGSFSLGSRTAYRIIYNRINDLMNYGLKGKENKNENNNV